MTLEEIVQRTAERLPDGVALEGPDGTLTYGELDALANRLARAFETLGVRRGDRVGLWLDKGVRAVAAMQGVLRVGAAYVPLDPTSPAVRVATILGDCQSPVVVTTGPRAEQLRAAGLGIRFLVVDGTAASDDAQSLPWSGLERFSGSPLPRLQMQDEELAYILYTSGSTGVPKGVCISHRNALAFIEWAYETLEITGEDRLSNHAPFFFDLSVLDLYAGFLGGARVCIVPEGLAFAPRKLVEFIQTQKITVWYSVPSALILMMEQGALLSEPSLPLRAILFAGEPFPTKHLRRLYERLPSARFLNLYGPTETNVCTWYEVKGLDPERIDPVPIGIASCGDRVWLAPSDAAPEGEAHEVGELMVEGPTVMLGYWGKPPQGSAPYATGDLCRKLPDGNFEYIGRRDNQVKVRGRRIEPGEIEAALLTHPRIREISVVASGVGLEAKLVAYVIAEDGAPLNLLEVKRHCAERLPRYMIVDVLQNVSELPRTPNGKVDRKQLKVRAEAERAALAEAPNGRQNG